MVAGLEEVEAIIRPGKLEEVKAALAGLASGAHSDQR